MLLIYEHSQVHMLSHGGVPGAGPILSNPWIGNNVPLGAPLAENEPVPLQTMSGTTGVKAMDCSRGMRCDWQQSNP
jgi:hypothetical protein